MNIETKTYPDGTTATGTAPLPDVSPLVPVAELQFVEAYLLMHLKDAREAGDKMDIECAEHAHNVALRALSAIGVTPWPDHKASDLLRLAYAAERVRSE